MNQLAVENSQPTLPIGQWWTRFRQAPVVLQLYVVFAVGYASFSIVSSSVPAVGSVVTPYVGWSAGTLYLFTLYFAVAAAVMPPRKMVYVVVGLLGLFTLFGCREVFTHVIWPDLHRVAPGNPYLVYHDLRPVFVIVLPAFWIAMLLSPSVRKWIRAVDGESRPYQFSLADMLYLMFVLCVALAASLALVGLMQRAAESLAPPLPASPSVTATVNAPPGTPQP